jgi:pimeloyl-ACP methyl ester carboxylesterase
MRRTWIVVLAVILALSTQALTPTLSQGERKAKCPDSEFTCITLKVPLDHFGQSAEQIDVVFGILPARKKAQRKGMFVTAVGGPGASGLASADSYTAVLDDSIRDAFDIVFFDQRGVGQSGGFQCADAVAKYYQSDGRAKTPQQEQAIVAAARTFAEECTAQLPQDKLKFYSTRQAVEDLEAFRKLIGDPLIWLYGESYGTQFAQWYAAAHPDRVAGLVIDGVVDLALSGPQFLRDSTGAFNDVLVQTLQACNDDPACRRDAGRDPVRAYDQLARRLDRAPAQFNYPLPSGQSVKRELNLSDLETAAAGFLYAEGERMLLQRAIAAAANDDLVPLARLFYSALGLDPATLAAITDPSYSDAVYYTVTCNDYAYFADAANASERAQRYLKFGDRVDREVPRMNSVFYGDLPCAFWPQGDPQPAYEPGFATLIPTLVLGATADPATPVGQGRNVFERLNNAYLITQRGGPHVIFGRGNACPDDIVTALLVEGKQPGLAETTCKGVVADGYVPLPPADARAFKDALEAMISAENEIVYSPEYYYWDQAGESGIGCGKSGSALFDLTNGENGATRFTLINCAFSTGFALTGTGRYNPNMDRFTLRVDVSGPRSGSLDYERRGDAYRVTGTLDGKSVDIRR